MNTGSHQKKATAPIAKAAPVIREAAPLAAEMKEGLPSELILKVICPTEVGIYLGEADVELVYQFKAISVSRAMMGKSSLLPSLCLRGR